MTRRPLIAGNWKMNGLRADGTALAKDVAAALNAVAEPNFEILVCPPYTLIGAVKAAAEGSNLLVGAQDCHMAEKGAHTGDISAAMLADAGCDYVIVGHSERRADHGEDDATVKAKAEAALAAGMKVIVCIGETLEQREAGRTLDVNKSQLNGSWPAGANAENTVIAYEPVWAIGTGKVASKEQAQEVHAAVRAELAAMTDADLAAATRILYGGSMKPGNAVELIGQADIDGGLIGGAALKAEDFMGIAAAC